MTLPKIYTPLRLFIQEEKAVILENGICVAREKPFCYF